MNVNESRHLLQPSSFAIHSCHMDQRIAAWALTTDAYSTSVLFVRYIAKYHITTCMRNCACYMYYMLDMTCLPIGQDMVKIELTFKLSPSAGSQRGLFSTWSTVIMEEWKYWNFLQSSLRTSRHVGLEAWSESSLLTMKSANVYKLFPWPRTNSC